MLHCRVKLRFIIQHLCRPLAALLRLSEMRRDGAAVIGGGVDFELPLGIGSNVVA
jgi:hypothetical protein